MPVVALWAAALVAKTASEAPTASAQAQTRVVNRIGSGISRFQLWFIRPWRRL
jgi:hypothetical protein